MKSFARTAFEVKATTVRRDAGRFHRTLMTEQYLDPEALAHVQQQRARRAVEYARARSPFYARFYAERGVAASAGSTAASWNDLPVLDRGIVKERAAEFPTPEAQGRAVRSALTGGSTGQPLRTMHDARTPSIAFSWRMYSWWGVQPWDDLARIGRWNFGRAADLQNAAAWWPTRQSYLDAGLMSPSAMTSFAERLRSRPPALLEGYVGAMLAFADHLDAEGIRIPGLRAVATTAAPLPASARLRIESVFGAPVHDEYRGSEIGWMAGECGERDGLHMFADRRRIEVLDADDRPVAPGEVGDIVVTDLDNRVFPLIRYRLGDRGSVMEGACACGVRLPRMRQPEGRTTDLIRLPGGGSVGHRLMGMFSAVPEAVRVFQIHQRANYSIVIRVVRGDIAEAERHVEDAVAVLRARLAGVPVEIEYVEELVMPRGKVQYVVSDAPVG